MAIAKMGRTYLGLSEFSIKGSVGINSIEVFEAFTIIIG